MNRLRAMTTGARQRFSRDTISRIAGPMAAGALAIGIFVADTLTDLEIAIAVFYVIVVLISVPFLQRRGVLLVSAACIALTLLSHLLTPGGDYQAGLINGAISLTAIAATTYLALRSEAARTAMAQARSQLKHLARVSSLGELAASIAHEVNQPLAGIAANGAASVRWLNAEPPNLEEAKRSATLIVEDAKRASAIVLGVRELARRTSPHVEMIKVQDVIEDVFSLTRGELSRRRVSVRTNLPDDLPPVQGDRIQLQQVTLNLVLNAIDAMDNDHGVRELLVTARLDDDRGMIQVTVEDTGHGLSAATGDRAFEAFYSTKAEGMGMGLTISRSIIEAHGGRIWMEAGKVGGAAVHFTLPTDTEDDHERA